MQILGWKTGFTLVELIVVVTIIAILSTIGFVSYSSYTVDSRDASRISQSQKMLEALNAYGAKNTLPLPDSYIAISDNVGTIVSYQWVAGEDVLDIIEYSNGGRDPKSKDFFPYVIDASRNEAQVIAYLENTTQNIGSQAFASEVNISSVKSMGSEVGFLLDGATDIPLNESTSTSPLNITSNSSITAIFSDDERITAAGQQIIHAMNYHIIDKSNYISITSTDAVDIYCTDNNESYAVFQDDSWVQLFSWEGVSYGNNSLSGRVVVYCWTTQDSIVSKSGNLDSIPSIPTSI